jgi:hypothetical protein
VVRALDVQRTRVRQHTLSMRHIVPPVARSAVDSRLSWTRQAAFSVACSERPPTGTATSVLRITARLTVCWPSIADGAAAGESRSRLDQRLYTRRHAAARSCGVFPAATTVPRTIGYNLLKHAIFARWRVQIPFAGSSAATSESTELDDQQEESVRPWERIGTGEPVFPSRSNSVVDSESSSSDDEAPILEAALSRLDGSAAPRVVATGTPAAPSASNETPPVGLHWHDPRSPWHEQGLRTAATLPADQVRGRTSSDHGQLVGDDDDDSYPYALRASPPPMGHYESGVEPQQRPQTARSCGRNGQAAAVRIGSSQEPEPEPEAEPGATLERVDRGARLQAALEQVDTCGRRYGQRGAMTGLDDGNSYASGELTRMSDDMLEGLQRELSRKLDDVTEEINRRQQAAIEHQVRTRMPLLR